MAQWSTLFLWVMCHLGYGHLWYLCARWSEGQIVPWEVSPTPHVFGVLVQTLKPDIVGVGWGKGGGAGAKLSGRLFKANKTTAFVDIQSQFLLFLATRSDFTEQSWSVPAWVRPRGLPLLWRSTHVTCAIFEYLYIGLPPLPPGPYQTHPGHIVTTKLTNSRAHLPNCNE